MRSDPAHGGPGRWGPVVVVVPVRPAGGRRALGRRTYGLGWVNSDGPSCVPASPRSPLLPGVRPPTSPSHSRSAPHATPVCPTRPGRVVHPDGRGLGALARSLLTAIPRCAARRAMAARTVPRGQRRSPPEGPAPLAWRACAQPYRDARRAAPLPCARSARRAVPPFPAAFAHRGGARGIGWFGRVCVSNGILGSRDPGDF